MRRIDVDVNGERFAREVEPRRLLSDFLRHELGLTATHVGCEHGVCGACTVQLDGEPIRSCLMLAVQANGRSIRTVEALGRPGEPLHPLQQAFQDAHALQCGFCTPGFLMSLEPLLRRDSPPDDDEILEAVAGNLCRCTGYRPILEAARRAVRRADV